MSFECAICSNTLEQPKGKHELITTNSELLSNTGAITKPKRKYGCWGQENEKLVATSCGHLFHRQCLNKWFQARFRQNLLPSCPYCTQEFEKRGDIVDLDVDFSDPIPKADRGGDKDRTKLKPSVYDRLMELSGYVDFVLAIAVSAASIIFFGSDSNCTI